MEDKRRLELVQSFFSGTGATYDQMANLGTLGFDRSWKRRILEKIPEGSTRIMDQACGTGILTFEIARKFPRSRIVGVELRDEYLDIARRKAKGLKLNNIEFILGRAEDVFLNEPFDCITSSYLAKYAEIENLIRNIRKMLRSGGVLIMHDFTYPSNGSFARIWEIYFRMLKTVGKWKYPEWKTVFEGLPILLRETRWVTDLLKCLRENAFSDITLESLTFGASAIVTARKPENPE